MKPVQKVLVTYDRHANSFEIETDIPEKKFYDYLFDICRAVENGEAGFFASEKDDLSVAIFEIFISGSAKDSLVRIATNGSKSMSRSVLSYLLSFRPGQKPDERIIFV